jgi:hypothetical protein
MHRKPTLEEETIVRDAAALAARVAALGSDRRFQVTRRLLEAAGWRITYTGDTR